MTVRDFLTPLTLMRGQTVILEAGGTWRVVQPVKLRREEARRLLLDESAEKLLSSEIGMVNFVQDHISVMYRMQEGT